MANESSHRYSAYFEKESAFQYCLEPLLHALAWHGSKRAIIESFPHFAHSLNYYHFKKIMADFGFDAGEEIRVEQAIEQHLLPCLLVDNEHAYIVLERTSAGYTVIQGDTGKKSVHTQLDGIMVHFKKAKSKKQDNVLKSMILPFKSKIIQIIIAAFFINLCSLALPFYVMSVYDKVILAASYSLLGKLLAGISIVLLGSIGFQIYQHRLLSFLSSTLNVAVSNAIFEKIINLSTSKIETVSLGSQFNKVKEFDSVREFISGPLAKVIIDLPFVVIYIIALYLLAGPVVLVVVASMVLMLIMTFLMRYRSEEVIQSTSKSTSNREEFLVESLSNMEQLQGMAAEETWVSRYRELSTAAAMSNYNASIFSGVSNHISDAMVVLTALVTISLGAYQVIEGSLSIGGLIAIMMLIWKVLSPIKSLQTNLPRLMQVSRSIKKVNALLLMDNEAPRSKHRIFSTELSGQIIFSKVSLRYMSDRAFVLNNINLALRQNLWVVSV